MYPCPRVTIISITLRFLIVYGWQKKFLFEISGADDVCRDGKLPRFAGWNIIRELRDVYKDLWKSSPNNEGPARLLSNRPAFAVCMGVRTVSIGQREPASAWPRVICSSSSMRHDIVQSTLLYGNFSAQKKLAWNNYNGL